MGHFAPNAAFGWRQKPVPKAAVPRVAGYFASDRIFKSFVSLSPAPMETSSASS
jgi:hypothetical protein